MTCKESPKTLQKEEARNMARHSSQPDDAASYGNVERIGFGLLMIGAPMLMIGAGFLHPEHSIENGTAYYRAAHDYSKLFYVSHTMFFLSAVLFVPSVVGIARLIHPSHPKAVFWGCILSLMGFI